jgi:hypothetical protein
MVWNISTRPSMLTAYYYSEAKSIGKKTQTVLVIDATTPEGRSRPGNISSTPRPECFLSPGSGTSEQHGAKWPSTHCWEERNVRSADLALPGWPGRLLSSSLAGRRRPQLRPKPEGRCSCWPQQAPPFFAIAPSCHSSSAGAMHGGDETRQR